MRYRRLWPPPLHVEQARCICNGSLCCLLKYAWCALTSEMEATDAAGVLILQLVTHRCHDVMEPEWLRPPDLVKPLVSGLKGFPFHRPALLVMIRPR